MFFDILPDELKQSAISVQTLLPLSPEDFEGDAGWSYDEVKKVLKYLTEQNYAILGGEVYGEKDGEPVFRGDNWYLNREPPTTPWQEYVKLSSEKAREYIDFYHARNGEGYYYVLSAVSEEGFERVMQVIKEREQNRQ